jgi:hypothetical protein
MFHTKSPHQALYLWQVLLQHAFHGAKV